MMRTMAAMVGCIVASAAQNQVPGWNFNKYVVDGSGEVIKHFGSNTAPDSKVLQAAIESVLP